MKDVILVGRMEVEGSVALRRCRVSNTEKTSASETGRSAVYLRDGGQANITDSTLTSARGAGLVVQHAGSFAFVCDVTVADCGGHGATVSHAGKLHATSCTFSNNKANGLFAKDSGAHLDVKDCTADGNTGHGFVVSAGAHMSADGRCIADGNDGSGFRLSGQTSEMVFRGVGSAMCNKGHGFLSTDRAGKGWEQANRGCISSTPPALQQPEQLGHVH
jgi:hypothetical protein